MDSLKNLTLLEWTDIWVSNQRWTLLILFLFNGWLYYSFSKKRVFTTLVASGIIYMDFLTKPFMIISFY